MKEKSFPRGRLESAATQSAIVTPDEEKELFQDDQAGTSKAQKKKLKRSIKRAKLNDEDNSVLANGAKFNQRNFHIDSLTYDHISVGFVSLGKIYQIQDFKICVSLPGRVVGTVSYENISGPYSEMIDAITSERTRRGGHSIGDMFKIGQVMIVKVINEEVTDKGKKLHLSMSPSDIHADYTPSSIASNTVMTCAVKSIEEHGYSMDMGIKGVNAFLKFDQSKLYEKNMKYRHGLRVGQLVQCKILDAKTQRLGGTVKLTANPKEVNNLIIPDETTENYNLLLPGWQVNGTVMDNHRTGMKVHFLSMIGLVHEDHTRDPWESPLISQIGSTIYPRILYKLPNGTNPYLTLKPSLVPHSTNLNKSDIVLGGKYRCKIHKIEKRGLVIKLDSEEKGIVYSQNCSDDGSWTEEEIGKHFPIGSTHECRVRSYAWMDQMFLCSFQESHMKENLHNIEQLKVGQKVSAHIIKWNNGGVIVKIGKILSAFIPKSEFPNRLKTKLDAKGPKQEFMAMVTDVKLEKNRIILTANKERWVNVSKEKPISFEGEPVSPRFYDMETSESEESVDECSSQISPDVVYAKKSERKRQAKFMKGALELDVSKLEKKKRKLEVKVPVEIPMKSSNDSNIDSLEINDDFWVAPLLNAENQLNVQNQVEIEIESPDKKKIGKTGIKREVEMRDIENRMADDTSIPTSNVEFERQILAHPNSSIGYIQYMAFHLAAAEVDKARSIARRAIEKINVREEIELLNVWSALLSLENQHGTSESMKNAIKEAILRNDELDITFKIIDIYMNSMEYDEALTLIKKLNKKYRTNTKVWEKFIDFYFTTKRFAEARDLVSKCQKTLTIKEYYFIASKAAQLEFSKGEVEKGKTLMDSLISFKPKRIDFCVLYANLLIKIGDVLGARQVYERALKTAGQFKKVKQLSAHLFEFERHHGNDETLQRAKKSVIERLSEEDRL